MARFLCVCGNTLSNSSAPNDVQLKIYTDVEWDNIINMGDLIDPTDIPNPKNDAWRCPKCERVYIFEGNNVIKIYTLESDSNILKKYLNANQT